MTVLRVALVGCGRRGRQVYLPVLAAMTGHFRLVGVCDEDEQRARDAAAVCGAVPYRSLDDLIDRARPDVCVLAVTPPPAPANERALLQCVESGVATLAETPIASTLAGADRVVAATARAGVAVEIAENYYRRPYDRFVRELVRAGMFGSVSVVYSDFVGHGYHGISTIRSHLGYHRRVVSVRGDRQRFPVAAHRQGPDGPVRDDELWQFGVLEVEDGGRGVFSFSTLSYHSPIRPRERAEVRFLASRGMRVGDRLTVLRDDGDADTLVATPRTAMVGDTEVLAAFTAPGSNVVWENPCADTHWPTGRGTATSTAPTIGLQLLALHRAALGDAEPEYGVARARDDRSVDLALERSWNTGRPVDLR